MDDLALLERWVRQGSNDAFTDLVARHAPMVASTCRRRLGDPAAADDAAQAVFLILARKAPALLRERLWSRPIIGDWLHRAACHVSANHARSRGRRERREQPVPVPRESTTAEAPTQELADQLDAAVAALPSTYRRPVVLHYLEGLDRAETAKALGIGEEAVHKRLQRGLALLRRRFGADDAATLAALAPLAPTDSGTSLASAVHGYLGGTSVPAAISTAIIGGLHAMQFPLIQAIIAGILVLSCAVGGAIVAQGADHPAPPAPAPAPHAEVLAYDLADGTVFWWDSQLDWTFKPEDGLKALPTDFLVPTRMHEYTIWRGEVARHVDGVPVVEMRPVWGWASLADAGNRKKITLPADADHPQRTIEYVDGGIDQAILQATLRPGRVAVDDNGTWSVNSGYGTTLAKFGMLDLLVPLPGGETVLEQPKPVFEGRMTLHAGRRLSYDVKSALARQHVFDTSMQVLGMSLNVAVSAEAEGSGTVEAIWNDDRHLPASADRDEVLKVKMTSQAAEGAKQEPPSMGGTLHVRSHAALLAMTYANGWPSGLGSLLADWKAERRDEWQKRRDGSTEPTLTVLANSVLIYFDTLPDASAADLRWPTPAMPNEF